MNYSQQAAVGLATAMIATILMSADIETKWRACGGLTDGQLEECGDWALKLTVVYYWTIIGLLIYSGLSIRLAILEDRARRSAA